MMKISSEKQVDYKYIFFYFINSVISIILNAAFRGDNRIMPVTYFSISQIKIIISSSLMPGEHEALLHFVKYIAYIC